jgi:hypothetical protein
VKHLILALLAATLSLSATAATNLNSSKSNVVEEAVTVKGSKSNSDNREAAPQGADTCSFTIDEKGVKRQATEAQKQKCEGAKTTTINNSKSNNLTTSTVCHSSDCPGCKYTCRYMGGGCLCIEGFDTPSPGPRSR